MSTIAAESAAKNPLIEQFEHMAFIRAFETKVQELSDSKPPLIAGSIHLCAGQEAIPVGARAALNDDDAVVCTYRGHGWALEFGITPRELMAEICHREDGINGGRAGSALVMAPERGFIGENSIVGAGAPIANGVALAFVGAGKGQVVLVSFGDGAMSQGALHEAMVFAAARSLPVIFVCENNGWSEMTPTDRIARVDRLAMRARGYGIPGATIDGDDPARVRDTIALAAERARNGGGPQFIECKTHRLWGHYNRDIEHYRPKADQEAAIVADALARLRRTIIEDGVASESELDARSARIGEGIERLAEEVLAFPDPDPTTARDHVLGAVGEIRELSSADTKEMTLQQALNTALEMELEADETVLVFGEDCGEAGGIFGVTRNLQRKFGEDRVFDTPIAEAAILGAGLGAAIKGLRPVVEIMWADFMLVALDQIINQAANMRYVTRGGTMAPLVIRTQQGTTPGSCAQHSQSLEALLAHIPGLRVGLVSTPQDGFDMLRAALAGNDPTVIIEARSLYQTKGEVDSAGAQLRAHGARLRREGADGLIISWGAAVNSCLDACGRLAGNGHDVAVLDLRWLSPLDTAAIDTAVASCNGPIMVVHEANLTGGFGAEIAAGINERVRPNRPVTRFATPDVRMPASPALQSALLPTGEAISEEFGKQLQPVGGSKN